MLPDKFLKENSAFFVLIIPLFILKFAGLDMLKLGSKIKSSKLTVCFPYYFLKLNFYMKHPYLV